MRFGLFGINIGVCAAGQTAAEIAQAAETAGFESVWTGEHVVLPDPQVPPSPVPPETAFLDPAIALTLVAAHTRRVRLGTGIIILPQRNPVVLAKELASLDRLSAGRLLLALGLGASDPLEHQGFGVASRERAPWVDEVLPLLRRFWTEEHVTHDGPRFHYEAMAVRPRPIQQPIDLWLGGLAPAALRRIGRLADARGHTALLRAGLVLSAVVSALLVLDKRPLLYAAIVVAAAVAYATLWTPALALLSRTLEREGFDQAFGFGLMSALWPPGFAIGAAAGGALAGATRDSWTYLLSGALCLFSLRILGRAAPRVSTSELGTR